MPHQNHNHIDLPSHDETVRGFDFGGTTLYLRSSSPEFLDMVAHRYPVLESDATFDVACTCSYTVTGPQCQTPEHLFEGRKAPVTFRALADGDWELEGRHFYSFFDQSAQHLAVVGPQAMFPLDLAWLALWYVLHPSGFIIHGAGLRFEDRDWLCSGPSGCGKSTLANLFPDQALCDEFCGILMGAEPELVSMPFWLCKPGRGKLAGIYMLQHAAENARSPLPEGQRFQRLAGQVYWPYFDETMSQRTLQLVARLSQTMVVERLGFRPTRDVATMFADGGGNLA